MSVEQSSPLIEEWRAVVGYEGLYEVSNQGRVRSVTAMVNGVFGRTQIRRGKVLRTHNSGAYPAVVLSRGGRVKTFRVHRLVLEAFVGPRPAGMEARHFPDRSTANNCLENLSWGTPLENGADRNSHGTQHRGERTPTAKLTEEQAIQVLLLCRSRDKTHAEIGRMFGISQGSVSRISLGTRWKHLQSKERET